VCGGIPLHPVAISVVKELNLACDTLLPAEPGIDAPPAPRGPGPSSHPPERPSGNRPTLTGKQEFTILYQFNDDYLEFGFNRMVTEAAAYAKQSAAKSVTVTGYRATSLLSNGDRLAEKEGLAEKRAQNIATVLRGLGVATVTVNSKPEAEPADGRTDPAHRRVTIVVAP
jgi:outer membrane protein OmpA-like peptidoglycan-associated protein